LVGWLHAYIDESHIEYEHMNIVVPKIFAKTRYNDNEGTGTGIDIEGPGSSVQEQGDPMRAMKDEDVVEDKDEGEGEN